jgi:hypothetical protein
VRGEDIYTQINNDNNNTKMPLKESIEKGWAVNAMAG